MMRKPVTLTQIGQAVFCTTLIAAYTGGQAVLVSSPYQPPMFAIRYPKR